MKIEEWTQAISKDQYINPGAWALLTWSRNNEPSRITEIFFLDLACLTHFPDRALCLFFQTSLNEQIKACLPGDSPQGTFAEFVEWVLANNNSPMTRGRNPCQPHSRPRA